jgi:hypothetical protein
MEGIEVFKSITQIIARRATEFSRQLLAGHSLEHQDKFGSKLAKKGAVEELLMGYC